jgi:hypothetical protein
MAQCTNSGHGENGLEINPLDQWVSGDIASRKAPAAA